MCKCKFVYFVLVNIRVNFTQYTLKQLFICKNPNIDCYSSLSTTYDLKYGN